MAKKNESHQDDAKPLKKATLAATSEIEKEIQRFLDKNFNGNLILQTAINESLARVTVTMGKFGAIARKWRDQDLKRIYEEEVKAADAEMEAAGLQLNELLVQQNITPERLTELHKEQLKGLQADFRNRFKDIAVTVARKTHDVYSSVQQESLLFGFKETDNIKAVISDMRSRLREKGIGAFVDTRGRTWHLDAYTDMAGRTISANARREARTMEFLAHGQKYVQISYHMPTCPMCAPWNGVVVSLDEPDDIAPHTLAEAEAAGLYHPNCRHLHSLWLPEFSDPAPNEPDIVVEGKPEPKPEQKIVVEKKTAPPELTPAERIEKAFANFEDDQKALMVSAFKDSPPEIIDLLETYKSELKFDMPERVPRGNGPAYYQPWNQTVVIQKGYNKNLIEETLQHEVGHFLDNIVAKKTKKSMWLSSSGDMLSALDNDRNQLRGGGKAKTAFKDKMMAAMQPGEKYYDNHAVSDIFSSMSGGKIQGGWGHKESYFKSNPENGRAEIFANLHQLEAVNDTEAIEFVRGFFPETVAAFKKWLYNKQNA
jgi:hypothetical protein